MVTFRRADLHKVHAYRDALGASSVWVLYPGGSEAVAKYSPQPSAHVEGSPDGVGAVPLTPGSSSSALKDLMERMLDE